MDATQVRIKDDHRCKSKVDHAYITLCKMAPVLESFVESKSAVNMGPDVA